MNKPIPSFEAHPGYWRRKAKRRSLEHDAKAAKEQAHKEEMQYWINEVARQNFRSIAYR